MVWSGHQSRHRLPDKVDPFKVVLMVSINLLGGRYNNDVSWQGIVFPDHSEEVPIKDDWSVSPHFGHLLRQLLLLRWAEHLASLAIACLPRGLHGVAKKVKIG